MNVTAQGKDSNVQVNRPASPEVFTPKQWNAMDLSDSHMMLLYLIHKYSDGDSGQAGCGDRWVRGIPLLVLMYEGIVAQVLDYDYAPQSIKVGRRRIFMNITQEGRDDIDDLREAGLVLSLKLTNNLNNNITAFKASKQGELALDVLDEEIKARIDNFVQHRPGPKGLKRVRWNGQGPGNFELYCPASEYMVRSTVTDCEDVSYVTSPYVPACLRECHWPPNSDNSSRAGEAAAGSNIRDVLDETIVLHQVTVLIGEWIPFGSNQVVALNDRLGSGERCQGGFLTALSDDDPQAMQFEQHEQSSLTEVQLLDFSPETYVNFEAEVHFPEDEDIVQVEDMGVHVDHQGSVVYGCALEAVLDRVKCNISLDLLSRVLADLHQDSSELIDSLISEHQRQLLDITYFGDKGNRDKYTIIMAGAIEPKMLASKYLDKEEHENELKQVLGDTYISYDLGINGEGLLVMGSAGCLFAINDYVKQEHLIASYLSLASLDSFVRNFFNRTFILTDMLKEIRDDIDHFERDPNSLQRIRSKLTTVGNDVVLLEEILSYIEETVNLACFPADTDAADLVSRKLYDILKLEQTHATLKLRTTDMKKNIIGCMHKIETLREQCQVISERQMLQFQEAMKANTKNLEDVFKAAERSGSSLEIMQLLMSGTLAFEILDRLTGEWSVVDTAWARHWIVDPFMSIPFLWFFINIMLWVIAASGLQFWMRKLNEQALSILVMNIKLNVPLDVKRLREYLATKSLKEESLEAAGVVQMRKVAWKDGDASLWLGFTPPSVEIVYEELNGFLMSCNLTFEKDKDRALPEEQLRLAFFADLQEHGVLEVDAHSMVVSDSGIAGTKS
eukprot:SAG31_NODE_858_length_11437_cov_38.887049_3_plen_844_part_00